MEFSLRYDLRAPSFSRPQADLFDACLEQCEWADEMGFESVNLQEHHGSDDGYNPSPLVLAGAIAARTRRMRIRVVALVLPLHDPVRIAEDAAVVDQISRGRLELVIGAGYVDAEFRMFGRDPAQRVQLQTEGLEILKKAWAGEPFERDGGSVEVWPRPFRRPRPPLILGGSSAGAARRAARIADGFEATMPHFEDVYREECARLGLAPPPPSKPRLPALFVHLAEDPDEAWARIAPHALHEMNAYGKWLSGDDGAAPYHLVEDADGLRSSGMYLVLTPEELLRRAAELGPGGVLNFHPLMGGLDPELAWSSLELFESRVVPGLRQAGLA